MSGSARRRAHAAIHRSTLNGFLSRNVGVLVVLGVVLALSGPAVQANTGDPVIAGAANFAGSTTTLDASSGLGLLAYSDDPRSDIPTIEGLQR